MTETPIEQAERLATEAEAAVVAQDALDIADEIAALTAAILETPAAGQNARVARRKNLYHIANAEQRARAAAAAL